MKAQHHPRSGKRGRKKRRSAAQRRSQAALAEASYGWSGVTDEERRAWDARAWTIPCRSRKGKTRHLSGQKYFIKVNAARIFLGLSMLRLPPAPATFRPSVVGPLRITRVRGVLAIKLSVSGAPAEHIRVLASPARNAGRRFCADYRYLCPLPPPVKGEVDITKPYIKKFGIPPAGKRIFVQTRRQVDGWQTFPAQSDALLPGHQWSLRSTVAGA
jgi:hypothetical protein